MPESRDELLARLAELRRLMPPRTCQASDGEADGPRWRCSVPEAGFFRTECFHGHIRDIYMCAGHAVRTDGKCWRCLQSGRTCSISVTRLEMAMDGWEPAGHV